jgi:hypothetical protein
MSFFAPIICSMAGPAIPPWGFTAMAGLAGSPAKSATGRAKAKAYLSGPTIPITDLTRWLAGQNPKKGVTMQRSQRLKKARALKGQLEQLRDGLESDAPEIDYIDDAVNSLDDAIFELSEFDDDGVDDAAYGYA